MLDTPACQLSVLWFPIPKIPLAARYQNAQLSPQPAQCPHQDMYLHRSLPSLEYWLALPLYLHLSPLLAHFQETLLHQPFHHLYPKQVSWVSGYFDPFLKDNVPVHEMRWLGLTFPSAVGCYYKGVVYQKGQTWSDGCQFDCVCLDDMSGQYQCTEK